MASTFFLYGRISVIELLSDKCQHKHRTECNPRFQVSHLGREPLSRLIRQFEYIGRIALGFIS